MKIKYILKFTIVLVVIVAILIVYNIINNNSIAVIKQEVKIKDLPEEFEGFTILQITDLHSKSFGKNQKKLTNLINKQSYDIIAITGDMQNKNDENYEPFIKLLEGIKNKSEIYYTPGNHGPYIYEDNTNYRFYNDKDDLCEHNNVDDLTDSVKSDSSYLLTEAGVYLKYMGVKNLDKVYSIKRGDKTLWISELIDNKDFSTLTNNQNTNNDIKIALTHYPMDEQYYLKNGGNKIPNYDLVLAGHYHGGQFRIPFYGALFVPDVLSNGWFPSQDKVSGLTEWGNFKQYVSRGLGASSDIDFLRFRLFNRPEINLIKLVRE